MAATDIEDIHEVVLNNIKFDGEVIYSVGDTGEIIRCAIAEKNIKITEQDAYSLVGMVGIKAEDGRRSGPDGYSQAQFPTHTFNP